MKMLYETKHFSVVRPWPGSGLRIMDKMLDRPAWGTGAFYDNMDGYLPDALSAAIDATNELQSELEASRKQAD